MWRKRTVRRMALACAVIMALNICALSGALAQNGADENDFTVSGGSIEKYQGSTARLEIPDTLGGAQVTAIGASAFAGSETLRSVVIPAGMTQIGDGAFEKCASLRRIRLSDTVTHIGDGAFRNSALCCLTLPEALNELGAEAFLDCPLKSAVVLGDTTEIAGSGMGFCTRGGRLVAIPGFVLYAPEGSPAQKYAQDNNFECRSYAAAPVGGGTSPVKGLVNCKTLELRTEPSTRNDHSILGQLHGDNFVNVLNKVTDWYYVETSDGVRGFVAAQHIKLSEPTGAEPLTEGAAGKVTAWALYVRSDMSNYDKSNVVWEIHRGDSVTIYQQEGGWYYVQTANGKQGYVIASFIDTEADIPKLW